MDTNENFASDFIVLGHDRGSMHMALIKRARKSSSYSHRPRLPSSPGESGDEEDGPIAIRRTAGPKLSLTTTTYATRPPPAYSDLDIWTASRPVGPNAARPSSSYVHGRRGGGGAGGETEIAAGGRAGGDGDGGGLLILTGEENAETGVAGRDLGEAELAAGVGERLERGALDGDAGEFDGVAGAEVGDAALDGAGGGGLGRGGGDEEQEREQGDEAEGAEMREGQFHGERSFGPKGRRARL